MGDNLSDSINEGKKNWQKMNEAKFTAEDVKKVERRIAVIQQQLEQETDPEEKDQLFSDLEDAQSVLNKIKTQLGLQNSVSTEKDFPSDEDMPATTTSGNSEFSKEKDERILKLYHELSENPAMKKLRKMVDPDGNLKRELSMASMTRKIGKEYLADFVKDKQADLETVIHKNIKVFEEKKLEAKKEAVVAAKDWNEWVNRVKQSRKTSAKEWTEVPAVSTAEEFAQFILNHMHKNDNLITFFMNIIAGNEGIAFKRDTAGTGHGGRNVGDVQDASNKSVHEQLATLYSSLDTVSDTGHNFLREKLSRILLAYNKLAMVQGTILGLKQKLQRVKARQSQLAKRDIINPDDVVVISDSLDENGDEESEAEKIDIQEVVLNQLAQMKRDDLVAELHKRLKAKYGRMTNPTTGFNPDEGDDSLAPVNESVKPGPGKVLSDKITKVEDISISDKVKNKKDGINQGWKKYSEKNKDAKNGEEPEGFSIVMG